jgi:TolB-like protein/DNA-binding winged helix-turn-helix (wHTH) protein/Tfp pilus assembly protein PilF
MSEELNNGFRIKNWEIWPLRDLLVGPDGEHHIEPKAMQVLVALAGHPEQVVTRENLLDEIWPDTYSGEVSLTRCVSQLRSSLSDERGNSEFIETIPKIGYRLVAPVEPYAGEKSHDQPRPNTWLIAAIAMLFLGFAFFIFDTLVLGPARHTVTVEAVFPSEYSIAVLPFTNVSDDPGNDHISEGISDDIRSLLTKIPEMQVTSRQSTVIVAGQNLDVATMAGKLNVAHFLEGSVRKSGNELRITAQLINVGTDKYIWSNSYDRTLEDVFAIQDEIAAAVVDALKIRLLGNVPRVVETSSEAYGLYLQARFLSNQFTATSNKRAEELIRQSLEIDPDFAPAWTALGNVYTSPNAFDYRPQDESIELAREAIQRALAIDPQNGPAYAALGEIAMGYDFDFNAAKENIQRALALDPGDAAILHSAARLNSTLGHLDDAIELLRRSVSLDPVSHLAHNYLGLMYYYDHRLDEAADALQMAQSLNPNGIFTHHLLGRTLLEQGDAQAALMEMERETADYLRLQGIALAQHTLGDTGASDSALQALKDCCALEASQIAAAYAFRGEIDHAFNWLEQAYDTRDGGLTFVLLNPLFDSLHDDPRWERFLDKMGLPH